MSQMVIGLILLGASGATISQEVVISCDVGLKWAYISAVNIVPSHIILEGKTRTKQVVTTSGLPPLGYSESQKLTAQSTGQALSAHCGPFSFVLSSTSVSAADVASVFSVWEGEQKVLGPLVIGLCALQRTAWGSCPKDWVRAASLRWDPKAASIAFDLEHSYQEFRSRPNTSLERTREK